jgi:hypothetical protein
VDGWSHKPLQYGLFNGLYLARMARVARVALKFADSMGLSQKWIFLEEPSCPLG